MEQAGGATGTVYVDGTENSGEQGLCEVCSNATVAVSAEE